MEFDVKATRAAVAALRAGVSQRTQALAAAGLGNAALLAALGVTAPDVRAAECDAAEDGAGADAAAAAAAELRALLATALLVQTPFEPLDSAALHRRLASGPSAARYAALGGASALPEALKALAAPPAPALELEAYTARGGEARLMVLDVDAARLALCVTPAEGAAVVVAAPAARKRRTPAAPRGGDELEALLAAPTHREAAARAGGAELAALLAAPTAREAAAAGRFRSVGGSAVTEYCPALTRAACSRGRAGKPPCTRLHFQRLMMPHTDVALGDCSYLDTCRHMRTCKFVHYALDPSDARAAVGGAAGPPVAVRPAASVPEGLAACSEAQWLSCDVRKFELGLLGQFGVIMADPPWDIHMDLPYGTMADDEMRQMAIAGLQSEGLLFLWVTGRAMELGRECLALWGYTFVQELLWVKTNQLQRIIRTGRTGHWLNHSKEHCLVGVKGSPPCNRGLDADVLVAEVRETSRKPDEVYALLERLSPGTRKLEVFGREHNCRPGWVTLGNQLPGVRLHDEPLRRRFLARYPERAGELTPLPRPDELP